MATEHPRRNYISLWQGGMILVAVAVLVRVVLGVWASFGAPAAPGRAAGAGPAPAETQTNTGGEVTVKATWQGPRDRLVFRIVMDTHVADLDTYDLTQLAVLRTGDGQDLRPTSWDAPTNGHHRDGTLTFPTTAADGTPLLAPGTNTVELVIRDVGGVPERRFRWTP